jgi:ribosomal protein L11 methyltransferase
MDEKWLEIHISIPSEAVETVGGALAQAGCTGVTVEERTLDTFVPPDPDEAPGEYLLKAYFPDEDPTALQQRVEQCLAGIAAQIPPPGARIVALLTLQEEDWAEDWKQHFGAVRIGRRLIVKPSWEDVPLSPDDAVVDLDPGMAFGTGTHATTRLCLEALSSLFDTGETPQRVLDVGTGSGILAIAAAALGASRVLACDIEEDACRIARENAERNGVGKQVEVTSRDLSELEGDFQVVLANILAEENARLASALAGRLAPGGVLVLSGILQEKEDLVSGAFATLDLQGPEISRLQEWSCMIYRRMN